ncbi:VOC family protein [Streptomyces sp. NPDC004542]|uniref:VOC family protein n=1 Tax=Streptomyces sp. NPDC004542 TaxID=3154281 RepID=UPI0033B24D5B
MTGSPHPDGSGPFADAPAFLCLGYVGISSERLDDWGTFATSRLGMQLVDDAGGTAVLRMDDRRQRVIVTDDGRRGYFGWEVASASAFDRIADALDAVGVRVRSMTSAERANRFVADGIVFRDPAGNRVEAVIHPAEDPTPFVPGRTHSGFRTGPLGLGHAVLTTPRYDELLSFYRDVLGFRLSDYTAQPFRASFLHLNARHHSLAIIETETVGIHHIMMEMNNMDDVGQAYDLALADPETIGVTLGRHSNDHMFSFYTRTPSDFLVECGWGGRSIDQATWTPCELTDGPSLWGHERFWLPPEARAVAYDMRVEAARRGSRAPVHVRPGNFDVATDAVAAPAKAALS